MKTFLFFCFILMCCHYFSCKEDDPPVSTPVIPPPKTMILNDYGSSLDSSFYKVWSDSSWEKFNRIISINGITYVTLIDNEGNEFYYSVIGYAGFKPQSESLILFDSPITSLPETVVFGQTYTRAVTYFYQGYNFTMKIDQYLQDTTSITVPFGTFNPCVWFKSKVTLSAGGQSQTQNSQFWLAKGPSDIKVTLNSGTTIIMVRGRVNSQGWGMPFPKSLSNIGQISASTYFKKMIKPVLRGTILHQLSIQKLLINKSK